MAGTKLAQKYVLRYCIVFLLSFFSNGLLGQSNTNQLKKAKLKTLFEQANTKNFSPYMAPMIAFELPNEKGVFGQKQGIFLLEKFFEKYPPVSFDFFHDDKLANYSIFYIGIYKSKQNNRFRVTLFIKQERENAWIQEIKIEPWILNKNQYKQ